MKYTSNYIIYLYDVDNIAEAILIIVIITLKYDLFKECRKTNRARKENKHDDWAEKEFRGKRSLMRNGTRHGSKLLLKGGLINRSKIQINKPRESIGVWPTI